MKKYIMTIVMALGFGMGLNAQNDGFFTSSYQQEGNREPSSGWGQLPSVIGHGYTYDQNADPAPLGTGLLLLAGMGIGYAAMRKRD